MKYIKLFFYYIYWHYSIALKDFFIVWKNLLWFSLSYFSVKLLVKTIYKPFKYLDENVSTAHHEKEPIIVSIFSSIAGFFIRVSSIIAGILFWVIVFVGGLIAFIIWLLLPFILLTMFIAGVAAIINTNEL